MVKYSHPIHRALIFDESKHLRLNWPEYSNTRTQDLPVTYHDSGSFYWVKSDAFLMEKTLFTRHGTGIVLEDDEVQDIDSEADWRLAEVKYRNING